MTYWQFHLIFNLPVLLVLGFWPGSWPEGEAGWWVWGAVLGIVILFTTPWDNYAVWRNIWNFPEDRVWFRIGWLPVEEYAFFVIQSAQVMLLVQILLSAGWGGMDSAAVDPGWMGAGALAVVLIMAGVGWMGRDIGARGPKSRWHYAWHLLFWFLPVVVLQWVMAGPILWDRLGLIVLAAGVIGTWLSAADAVAVHEGIWFFDPEQITGWKFFGRLPWEVVAFFYLTSLLVAQSYLMFLPESLR